MPLIEFTGKGLYCPQGDFYIDPWSPVNKAVITHGHSDHARFGHKAYLSHPFTKIIMQARLGNNHYETLQWNEALNINGVKLSLHPAGHIIGSSQVRLEYNGEVWVFTGDYKLEDDGISTAFEPIKCNVFITESTFGLPIYNWKPQETVFDEMQQWIQLNRQAGKNSIILGYSLGKAQRILKAISSITDTIYVHGAIYNMHIALQQAGFDLPKVIRITRETPKEAFSNAVIIAPPGADGSSWIKRFSPYAVGICSGWMQVRGNMRRKNADAGFVLSDHADWKGLITAVKNTGAEKVYATHGFQAAFSRYITEQGIEAAEVKTAYGTEEEENTVVNDDIINENPHSVI